MSNPKFQYGRLASTQIAKMIGRRFERLIVLSDFGYNNSKQITYVCACDCGNFSRTSGGNLRTGVTKSCGCYQRDFGGQKPHDGGSVALRFRREYKSWRAMIRRCHEESHPSYPEYGAKGITVCKRWRDSYSAFFEDMGPAASEGHTIDRIDNSLGYNTDNCRWADRIQQNQNRRNVVRVRIGDIDLPLPAAARSIGCSAKLIRERMKASQITAQQAIDAELIRFGRSL